jgi:sialidase-1
LGGPAWQWGAAPLSAHADHGPAEATTSYDATPWFAGEPYYAEQDLAVGGQGGFPNYRIPALAVTNDGEILASYDGRPTSADAPGPNSILQRRSLDGGATWGEQTVIYAGKTDAPIEGYSDPSYIVDRHTGDIFNFHVFSMDQGFIGSRPGVDPTDRNVLHAQVTVSRDGAHTWERRIITADITPDLGWRSRFAASGQGIQLRYGPYAGRLLQQFTIINEAGDFQAVSVYSDDHGETWQAGEPVGIGMDENKTVELSDGRIMLNSRDSHRSGFRKVAISTDGGLTYGEVRIDQQLPDPTNNASIIRAFPDAPEGSARAKVLLFSNAGSSSHRGNGTIRMSCDDGETWPVSKVFQPGEMAYSTLATLPNGNIGLLYEPGHNGIRFAEFNLAWLEGICAGITADAATIEKGASAQLDIEIENQGFVALRVANVTVDVPEGWEAVASEVPVTIRPGASTTVPVSVTVPATASAGTYDLDVSVQDRAGRTARGSVAITVPTGS